jgi:hypothetical protein
VQEELRGSSTAEAMLRRLLPDLAPQSFQHFMRVVWHDILIPLDPTRTGRQACILNYLGRVAPGSR